MMRILGTNAGRFGTPVLSAWFLFASVLATALSLAVIGSLNAREFGYQGDPVSLFWTTLIVTACVATPIATIVAQNNLNISSLRRTVEAMGPTDGLTGLLNRSFFELAIRDERSRMEHSHRKAAIALFEVDKLDALRAELGDDFADQIVRQVSVIAHTELRGPFDKLARWSHETFIILLSDVTVSQAVNICERLRERIDDATMRYRGDRTNVTASFGVAQFSSDESLEDATIEADEALYNAQRFGRNQVRAA